MAEYKILIAGFGGQGVMLMGQMIAYAAMYENKEVTWLPSYGPEMRGGTANCSIIVSERKISCPILLSASVVVAMNLPSLIKFENMVEPGGKLFVNTSFVSKAPSRTDIDIVNVDAGTIAERLNNIKVSNMVMLGALVRETGAVKLETVEKVMEKLFTGSKAELLPLNREALAAWKR